MKRMLALLLALLMLPLSAQAFEMEQEKNYVSFPELDGLRLRFRSAAEWTIVTRDNLELRVMGGFIICLPHKISVEVRDG